MRSMKAPWRIVTETLDAAIRPAPDNCNIPSLMVTVPVRVLTPAKINVPAPFLVSPPVMPLTTVEMSNRSEAPFTRITKAPAPPVVRLVPPEISESPPVATMPPKVPAAPVRTVRVCDGFKVSVLLPLILRLETVRLAVLKLPVISL